MSTFLYLRKKAEMVAGKGAECLVHVFKLYVDRAFFERSTKNGFSIFSSVIETDLHSTV